MLQLFKFDCLFKGETLKYIIDQEPQPALRPRWGNGHVYDSQALLKTVTALNIAKQHKGAPAFTGPLAIYIQFYIGIPAGKKNLVRLHKPCTYKPDIDNLSKMILDCITKSHIIRDDSVICELHAAKSYKLKGSTEFEIIELQGDGKKESTEVETKKSTSNK